MTSIFKLNRQSVFLNKLLSREQQQENPQDEQNLKCGVLSTTVLCASACLHVCKNDTARLAGQHRHADTARNAVAFPALSVFPEESHNLTS